MLGFTFTRTLEGKIYIQTMKHVNIVQEHETQYLDLNGIYNKSQI